MTQNVVSISISDELLEKLDKRAEQENRKRSAMAAILLEKGLEE